MAIILSATDLDPLLNNPASMDALLNEIEGVLAAQQRNAITSQGGFRVPMVPRVAVASRKRGHSYLSAADK